MALNTNIVSGGTVLATDVSSIVGLLKGIAGNADTMTPTNNVANFVTWKALSPDPAAGTPMFIITDSAGNTKWTQYYTGEQWFKTATPYIRLEGTEASALDMRIAENAGKFTVQQNTGTEGVPIWTDRATVDLTTGDVTGGKFNGIVVGSAVDGFVAAAYMV